MDYDLDIAEDELGERLEREVRHIRTKHCKLTFNL